MHFLSEEISAVLRMISCPAILMFYQKLAQARTGFQEMETIHLMTFQAAHRSAKYRSIWQCKVGQSGSFGSWLCISQIRIPLSVVQAVCQNFRDMPPDAVTRYQKPSVSFFASNLHILRQNCLIMSISLAAYS